MTLLHKPEHEIRTALEEHRVAHFTFATETGMRRFIDDNRASIRTMIENWNVDYYPMLTVTAR